MTASGKVIEAETDLLKKKLESTRAAEAAASVPKADPLWHLDLPTKKGTDHSAFGRRVI